MNFHPRASDRSEMTEAADLRARLRDWAAHASTDEIAAMAPDLRKAIGQAAPSRRYPEDFQPDAAYKATMPDLQNGPQSTIRGTARQIQHVGISNFRLPLRVATRGGDILTLDTSVTGTVSLAAEKKGINMSRIMRSFYRHAEETVSFEVAERTLDAYKIDLESFDAHIQMRFALPLRVESLRSGLAGWQYYDIALEVADAAGQRRRIVHLDYVYSSTCPCSLELSEHARQTRGQLATPHSQRSVARISVELAPGDPLLPEDLIDHCRVAIPTETQAMVKREDEQAFAELNAANPIFVEDAVRLLAERLHDDSRIGAYRIAATHFESLHSHDAVSVLTEGETFAQASLDPRFFASLHRSG